jgi:hypothetical protein
MKKYAFALSICIVSLFTAASVFAQAPTKASDFTLTDCNGSEHHLFSELDKGNVVMMEFVMGCLPCVQGRQALASIEDGFNLTQPGKVQSYTFGFSGSVDCSSISSWMSDNNFSGTTFGGDDNVNASYGAAGGMPTICIVAGIDHKVIYWKKGFAKKDTVAMKTAISKALSLASVASSIQTESLSVYPNPAVSGVTLKIDCTTDATHEITLYNANGVKLLSIFTGKLLTGEHSIGFSTKELANGAYYIHVTTAGKTAILPLTVLH